MTIRSYPFDNQTTTELDVSMLFAEFQDSGVAASADSSDFSVYGDGAAMTVHIRPGFALVNGYACDSSDIEDVPIAASGTSARQDLIVLRCDPASDSIAPAVKTGEAGAGVPVPTWDAPSGITELPLAVVNVAANVTTIDASAVTDARRFAGGRVGVWGTDTRPTFPRLSQAGFNKTTNAWEFWDGTQWSSLTSWDRVTNKPATYPPSAHTHQRRYATYVAGSLHSSGPGTTYCTVNVNYPPGTFATAPVVWVQIRSADNGAIGGTAIITANTTSYSTIRADFPNGLTGTVTLYVWATEQDG